MKKNTKLALLALVAVLIIAAAVIILTRPGSKTGADGAAAMAEPAEDVTPGPAADAGENEAEPAADDAAGESTESNELLVTVNGEEIREDSDSLNLWIDMYYNQYGAEDEETFQLLKQYALDSDIRFTVMGQKLTEKGMVMTEEDLATLKEDGEESWKSELADIMEEQFGVGEDASDEDKTAAWADAVAYVADQYGITEEEYLEEYLKYGKIEYIYNTVYGMASENVNPTDEEVKAYFTQLVDEDREVLLSFAGGDELGEEDTVEALVSAYEFYTMYYGYSFLYMPEGYRGITHILLKVDDTLMSSWQDLQARLEEQEKEDAEATDGTDAEADAADDEEPVTREMVDAAKQAILDSVQDQVAEIKAKLAGGKSFEELIAEYGTDPGMEDETNLAEGYPVHKYSIMWDSNFTDAAMALNNIGDVSEPVIGQNGVHILYYLRDIPGGSVEYTDELRDELREELKATQTEDAMEAIIDQWIAESDITWTEAGEPWMIPAEEEVEEADE